jgi:hypothetical protein
MSTFLKQLNDRRWRYDTAIEALTELVENDNEIEPVKTMITYLKEKKTIAFNEWKQQSDLNDIQVIGVEEVSNQL